MKALSLGDLPRYFREKAEELREDFAAGGRARAVEWCAEQVEKALKEGTLEELTLDEAAAESGYSRNLSTTMGHSTGLIREQCPVW